MGRSLVITENIYQNKIDRLLSEEMQGRWPPTQKFWRAAESAPAFYVQNEKVNAFYIRNENIVLFALWETG